MVTSDQVKQLIGKTLEVEHVNVETIANRERESLNIRFKVSNVSLTPDEDIEQEIKKMTKSDFVKQE